MARIHTLDLPKLESEARAYFNERAGQKPGWPPKLPEAYVDKLALAIAKARLRARIRAERQR